MMKTKLLFLFLLFMTLLSVASCQFQNFNSLSNKKNDNSINFEQIAQLKPKYSTNLMADEYLDIGNVNIYSDDENVYVEYETSDEWYLTNIHLYVGDLEFIPSKKDQELNPKRFPISTVCPKQTQSKIFAFSKSNLSENFAVSAFAEVKYEINGNLTKPQSAWCEGDHFSTLSQGMYFNVSKMSANKDYVSL